MSDEHNLELLFATTGGLPYRPATYTCITEFTDSFPKKKADAFVAPLPDTEPAYQPEAPYPRIYTKDYRKSILSTLKQPIGKT
jgi:hypothetical protein